MGISRGPATEGQNRRLSRGRVHAISLNPGILLLAFLPLVFLTGGGSRAEIASLMLLRPMAVLVLFAGLITISRQDLVRFRWLFWLAGATTVLCLAHLVPLPPDIWRALPGREIIVEIDQFAGIGDQWRPITMDPIGGYNAAWSLTVPLAVLVLAVQLDAQDHRRVLAAILLLGALSAVVGLLQLLGGTQSPLYFYRVSSPGLPVGLFANRNHQAVFLACLVPMAAAWLRNFSGGSARQANSRWPLALLFAVLAAFLIAIVLITGSRAGLAAMTIALPGAAWVYGLFDRAPVGVANDSLGKRARRIGILVLLLLPVLGLSVLSANLGRGLAVERLLGNSPADDLRAQIVPQAFDMTLQYAPIGSGLGSFEPLFKLHESDDFLGPAYVNHVHNDFLEVAMTLGLPGVMLLLAALFTVALAARRVLATSSRSADNALPRASLVVLFLLAFATLWDYPLRVPSMMALGILTAVWLGGGKLAERSPGIRSASGSRKSKGFQ